MSGQQEWSGEPQTARVILSYGFDKKGTFQPEILAVDLLDVPPPLDEDTIPESGAEGAWLDVLAPGGALVFRVEVPAPGTGAEAADADSALVRREAAAGRFVSTVVEVPWYGKGTRIVLRHAKGEATGGAIATRSVPGLASLELVPRAGTRAPGRAEALPIWGHDNARAIGLLFLAEAFQAAEEPAFVAAVDGCLEAFGKSLAQVSPGRDLRRAFAPFRLMLASSDSGIDVRPRRTALKAHWQDGAADQRLILIDERAAAKHHAVLGRSRSVQAIAVVNTTRYGGAGGATAVTSRDPAAMGEVLVHELGHSLFNLGDEYVDEPRVKDMGAPNKANVTGPFTSAADLKWRLLLTQNLAVPTAPGAPAPPGARPPLVGAYEGAYYKASGRFRPSETCKMRITNADFCPVCADAIMQRLSPHL